MKARIPTPGGRVSLFTLALIGASQAIVWLVRSQRARDPSYFDPGGYFRCC